MNSSPVEPQGEWVDINVPTSIERWDGTKFELFTPPPVASVYHLFARSEIELWAAGEAGLYLWNGMSWSLPLKEGPIYRSWGSLGGMEVWAAGPAGLHYSNGRTWTTVLDRQAGARLRVVTGVSTSEAWIGGTGGLLQRYTGRSWRPIEAQGDVLAICAPVTGSAWIALGDEHDPDSGSLVRWDGEGLRPHDLEGARVRQLSCTSPDDVWGVGSKGTVVQWDGRAWSHHQLGISFDLRSVWGSGPEDVWVAGNAGRLLHWDGSAWTDRSRPEGADLAAVSGLDRERVWVAARSYRARRASHLDA